MPFIHPAIFALGLGCVSVPVIIHLLNRRRFRVRPWAAMQFLLDSLRRNRRRLRIEEFILLALRCLIILALAAAVSRFTGCDAGQILPASGAGHTSVFVLDDTCSMGQKVASATVFRAAAADLMEQIRKLSKGDKVAVVLASALEGDKAFLQTTHVGKMTEAELQDLRDDLAALKPSDRRARLSETLSIAGRLLQSAEGAKRLYLLSDFRRADLVDRAQAEAIAAQFKLLRAQGVEAVALDYGRPARDNLTVESIELLDKFAVAGGDMRLRVSVRNNAPTAASDVKVTISARFAGADGVRDVTLPVRTIGAIEPGEVSDLEFRVTADQAGSAVVGVALGHDELDGDNRAWIALDVRAAVKVLIVDGRVDLEDPTGSESAFLATAIDPNRNGDSGVLAHVVTPGGMEGERLGDYDVVVLLDVGDLPASLSADGKDVTYPQLAALERYVADGGGLAVFTGDNVNLTFYNRQMYAAGLGLSPLRIGPRVGDPAGREKYYRLDPKSISGDVAVRQFHGDAAVCTMLVRFFAFTPAEVPVAPVSSARAKPPRVLARFTDPQNRPAIVARQFGRGMVVTYYTTSSTRWNDWGVDDPPGLYVAPMLDMVAQLARPQGRREGVMVGEPIYHELHGEMRYAQATLKTPRYPEADLISLTPQRGFDRLADRIAAVADALADGDEQVSMALRAAGEGVRSALAGQDSAAAKASLKQVLAVLAPIRGGRAEAGRLYGEIEAVSETQGSELAGHELRHDRAEHAGVYTLKLEVPGASRATVLFARNSDPREGRLAPGGQAALTAALDSEDFTYVSRAGATASARVETSAGREYWMWALAAMLAMLALETALALRFGHHSNPADKR